MVNIASLAAVFATMLGISLVLLRLHSEQYASRSHVNDATNQHPRRPAATSGEFLEFNGAFEGFSALDQDPNRPQAYPHK